MSKRSRRRFRQSFVVGLARSLCIPLTAGLAADAAAQGLPLDASDLPVETVCSVGADDGPSEELFGRIVSVAPDSVGRLYVVDAVDQSVRVFGASCDYQRTLGRRGEGPGEYRVPISVRIAGDRVYVFDVNARKRIVYSLRGDHIDDRTGLEVDQGLCCGYQIAPAGFGRGDQPGYLLLQRAGTADTLATIELGRPFAYAPGRQAEGRMLGFDYGMSASAIPLSDSLLVVADGYTTEMTYYALSATGRPMVARHIDLEIRAPTLTASDRSRNTQEARQAFGGRAQVRSPDTWSLAANMLFDGASHLWLQTGDPRVWLTVPVYGARARVWRLPPGFTLKTVARRFLIGTTTTANGAPVLTKLRLVDSID